MLRLIERALERHDYNQSQAARYLRITREALRYRLGKLGRRPATQGGKPHAAATDEP